MKIIQKQIRLRAFSRGFHLVTEEILDQIPEIQKINTGNLHVFLQHTSAGISINENADPTVLKDFEAFVNDLVPEGYPKFVHTYEGPDDMPAHIKSSLFGNQLNIPVTHGKLNLGTWQGIYLCEFRDHGGPRKLVLTLIGA